MPVNGNDVPVKNLVAHCCSVTNLGYRFVERQAVALCVEAWHCLSDEDIGKVRHFVADLVLQIVASVGRVADFDSCVAITYQTIQQQIDLLGLGIDLD